MLLRTYFLSLISVDKAGKAVDKKSLDPPLPSLLVKSEGPPFKEKALIPTFLPKYPQLSTPFPHLGVKGLKRTTFNRSFRMNS